MRISVVCNPKELAIVERRVGERRRDVLMKNNIPVLNEVIAMSDLAQR